ncbi:MAG TPA: type II secretion system protein [Phycisphaerales bacterium]|nr:type II secretion system protein [Phycisphaerales bacterium]
MEPARHNPRRTRRSLRRGLTFIETVCAVALLGIVAATVYATFGTIMGTQDRQQHRLNAMEVANRLILQYLDDARTMPQAGLPVEYGKYRYRWELTEVPVRLVPSRQDIADERASAAPISVDRMQALAVKVWLSEESGGSLQYDTAVPAVALTRLMDPIALRNPDTNILLATDQHKQSEFLERFNRIGRNATNRGRNNASGTTPRSNPTPRAQPTTTPTNTPTKGGNPQPRGSKPLTGGGK